MQELTYILWRMFFTAQQRKSHGKSSENPAVAFF